MTDADFGSLAGPFCDDSWELSVRARLQTLDGNELIGWLWWTLDDAGRVLPGRLKAGAGDASNTWALNNHVIDDGILGIDVDGTEARLFSARTHDDVTLQWTGVKELPDIEPAEVSWFGP